MPTFIVKLAGKYLEWSTIVDAPVTNGMTLDEFREYYREWYGRAALPGLDERLARVEQTGTSNRDGETPEQLIACNRAGPNETELTLDQIVERFITHPETVHG